MRLHGYPVTWIESLSCDQMLHRTFNCKNVIGGMPSVIYLLLVEVRFLGCHRNNNVLRPPWEDVVSWRALLMM